MKRNLPKLTGSLLSLAGTLLVSTPSVAQEVQAALAFLQYFESTQQTGSSTSWIGLEFDAVNIKLDQIIKNEERLAQGLNALSHQIDLLETHVVAEMNAAPYKSMLASLVSRQAKVNDLADFITNVENLPEDKRANGYKLARNTLENIKAESNDVLAQLAETVALLERRSQTMGGRG